MFDTWRRSSLVKTQLYLGVAGELEVVAVDEALAVQPVEVVVRPRE